MSGRQVHARLRRFQCCLMQGAWQWINGTRRSKDLILLEQLARPFPILKELATRESRLAREEWPEPMPRQ